MRKSVLFIAMAIIVLVVGVRGVDAGEDPTTHPDPLPLSNIRPDHPRLWFNSDNLHLLRERWHDPAYAEIVNKYRGKSNPISLALEGLATGNSAKCSQAAATVRFDYGPDRNAESGYAADPIAVVFDWCYDALDSSQRADLISKIEALRDEHKNNEQRGVRHFFRWHGAYLRSAFSYIGSVLAIEGEPGVSSELREAQNVLQNLQELGDEVSGDGGYRAYFYQGPIHPLPFVLWSYATDMDFVMRSSFSRSLVAWTVRKLAPSGAGFVRGAGDDAAFEDGFINDRIAAGGFYVLASHLDDPVAQWLGNHIENVFGQRTHWPNVDGPSFLSLLHFDPERTALSPSQSHMSLTAFFDKIGMVHSRSSWGVGADVIHTWFYSGPATAHSTESQNHFTIWRGDDPLIMRGGNYLGTPSTYQSHYYRPSVSGNSLLFSPIGSGSPDHDGSQSVVWSSAEANAEHYPVAERVASYSNQHRYRGGVVHFEEAGRYMVASGSAEYAYNPDEVAFHVRDFVYLKPDVFVIRDRFHTNGIDTIRSLIHSRHKPRFEGSVTVLEGSVDAGIIETMGSKFQVAHGSSQAEITVLWPEHPRLRFVGGAGYEGYADGYNTNPWNDCQEWLKGHWELPERVKLIEGQWRTEIETTPWQSDGTVIQAVSVSGRDPDSKPSFFLQEIGQDWIVTVVHPRNTTIVVFPGNDTPRVYSPRRRTTGRRIVPQEGQIENSVK
jgi:hypothetical protein